MPRDVQLHRVAAILMLVASVLLFVRSIRNDQKLARVAGGATSVAASVFFLAARRAERGTDAK